MNTSGTVMAFEYRACPQVEFEDAVVALAGGLQADGAPSLSLSWDCDDIAIAEMDGLRLALGWLPPDEDYGSWYMVAAIGPTGETATDQACDALAKRVSILVDSILPSDGVLRSPAYQPVTAAFLDLVFELLRHNVTVPVIHEHAALPAPEKVSGAMPKSERFQPIETMDWDFSVDTGIGDIRPDDVEIYTPPIVDWLNTRAQSTQTLRLTVHTLALSMMLYVPPIGAAMFAYTLLRDLVPLAT